MRLSPIDYKIYFRHHTLYDSLVTDHQMNDDLPFGLLYDQLDENKPDYFEDGMDAILDSILLDDYAGRSISNAFASCYDIDFDAHRVDDMYSSSELTRLMMQIYLKYHMKWQRIYDALYAAEYDPIANVDANETESTSIEDSSSESGSDNRSISMSGTDSDSISIGSSTESTTKSSSGSEKNTEKLGATLSSLAAMSSEPVKEYSDIAGFNSVINPPTSDYPESSRVRRSGTTANEKDISESGTESTSYSGHSDTHTISHNDSGTNNLSHSLEASGSKSISTSKTRHGNIGVTMTQQLIDAEIELRNKWQFYNILIADVANELTLSIY